MIDLKTASWNEVLDHVTRPSPADGAMEELAHSYGRLQAICEHLIAIRDDLKAQIEANK